MTGSHVIYYDERAVPHAALVTTTFGGAGNSGYPDDAKPSVNLVYVVQDEKKADQYGRQIERATSVVHKNSQYAHGRYWIEA